jgi:hypothetical protein
MLTAYADKARSTSKDTATVRMLRTEAAKVPVLPVAIRAGWVATVWTGCEFDCVMISSGSGGIGRSMEETITTLSNYRV